MVETIGTKKKAALMPPTAEEFPQEQEQPPVSDSIPPDGVSPEEEEEEEEEERPLPPEARLYHRSPNPGAIGQNHTVRSVGAILTQGARYSRKSFPVHTNLIQEMTMAHAAHDEEAFLGKLTSYLEQAAGKIPSAASRELAVAYVSGLTVLIRELDLDGHDGFFLVGRYLLSVARSVVDFF